MAEITSVEISKYVVDHCLGEQTDLTDAVVLQVLISFGLGKSEQDFIDEVFGLAEHELMNRNDILASSQDVI